MRGSEKFYCWNEKFVGSPDGKRIATVGSGGIVLIHITDTNELLQIAESRVIRQLTAEEKEKYGVLDLN